MSEKTLITALRKDYAKLDPADRKQKIRELIRESAANRDFIKNYFPEFYVEVFPNRSRGASKTWKSNSRAALVAKHR
jgi:hypothetical protein